MKLKIQAQHLQPGDIVGSGEKIVAVVINSIHWPSTKIFIQLETKQGGLRASYWGKHTLINIDREEKVNG